MKKPIAAALPPASPVKSGGSSQGGWQFHKCTPPTPAMVPISRACYDTSRRQSSFGSSPSSEISQSNIAAEIWDDTSCRIEHDEDFHQWLVATFDTPRKSSHPSEPNDVAETTTQSSNGLGVELTANERPTDETPPVDNTSVVDSDGSFGLIIQDTPPAPPPDVETKPPSHPSGTGEDKLYSIIHPVWHSMCRELGTSLNLVILTMLATVSAAAGKRFVLVVGGRRIFPNIYVLAAFMASFGKTVIEMQIAAPLRAFQTRLRNQRKAKEKELRTEFYMIRTAKILLSKDIKELDSEAARTYAALIAELDRHLEEIRRELLQTGVFIVNDMTPAGLLRDLESALDNFVAIFDSDARQALGTMGNSQTHHGKDLFKILIKCFLGDPITATRGMNGIVGRHRIIEHLRATLFYLVQPDSLDAFFKITETHSSGFGPRVIYAYSEEAGSRPGNMSQTSISAWNNQIEKITERENLRESHYVKRIAARKAFVDNIIDGLPTESNKGQWEILIKGKWQPIPNESSNLLPALVVIPDDSEFPPQEVHMSQDAQARLYAIDEEYETLVKNATDVRLSAMWKRAEDNLRRLSLCFALMRPEFFDTSLVLLEDVEAANVIVRESAKTFAELCTKTGSSAPQPADVQKLREILMENGGCMHIKQLKGADVSEAKAKRLADKYPKEFSVIRKRTGKRGKPPWMIQLAETQS